MESLLLWNRLGSAAQVRASEVGPDGTFLGGGRFSEGRFGGAFEARYDQDKQVLFPKAGLVPAGEGAVEFWGRLIDPPTSIETGDRPYFISGQSIEGRNQDNIYVGFNANNGVGLAGIVGGIGGGGSNYPEQGLYTSRYADTYAGILGSDVEAWHHYALVWDEGGLPGIGDGTLPVALYVDGVMVSQDWQLYPGSGIEPFGRTFALLDNFNEQGSSAIDNLKLWDFAKTDFSDRFVEGFTLVGTPRADRLTGSVAGDDLRGLGGSDTLLGLAGNDLLRGDAGADLLRGGAGRDVLLGGAGDDRLYGDCGFDDISDGAGRDAMWGGGAADVFRLAKDGQLDRICDFGGADRIDLSAWGVGYDDLRIADLPDGRVRIVAGAETLDVGGRGVDAADLTEDRFIFADGPDLDWVQWSKADGGNGHWYALVIEPDPLSWSEADARAEALVDGKGHLVTLTSSAENDFVFERLASDSAAWQYDRGPYLGLYQPPGSTEPGGGWRWVTGEPLKFTNWGVNQPDNNGVPSEDVGHFYGDPSEGLIARTWNDISPEFDTYAYIAEIDDPLAFG